MSWLDTDEDDVARWEEKLTKCKRLKAICLKVRPIAQEMEDLINSETFGISNPISDVAIRVVLETLDKNMEGLQNAIKAGKKEIAQRKKYT